MQRISASGKTLSAADLVSISPVILLFSGLARRMSNDIEHEVGAVTAMLGLSGVVAPCVLYKLHHPR